MKVWSAAGAPVASGVKLRYAPDINASNPVIPAADSCGLTTQKWVLSVTNDSKRGSIPKRPSTASFFWSYQMSRNLPTAMPLYTTLDKPLVNPSADDNCTLTNILVSAA